MKSGCKRCDEVLSQPCPICEAPRGERCTVTDSYGDRVAVTWTHWMRPS